MSRQKNNKRILVLLYSVCCLLMAMSILHAEYQNMEEEIVVGDLEAEPMTISEHVLKYAPDRIIVKFKGATIGILEEEIKRHKSVHDIKLSSKLDALNKKYKINTIKPLFPNFKDKQKKLSDLKFKKKANLTKKEAHLLQRSKRAPKNAVIPDLSGIYVLELGEGQSAKKAVREYGANPEIEYAELDYVVSVNYTPNDPYFEYLWGLHNTGQVYPTSGKSYAPTPPGTVDVDIDAPEAWDYGCSQETVVAVIDTGVDYNHRDLDDNIWINTDEIVDNGIDDDNNGYIDDIYGYDFCTYGQTRDSDPIDDHGHGTHCSGIIAAEGDNSLDVVGVNYDMAKIMAIKFLGASGRGYTADAVDCVYYAVLNGADVMSNSWGYLDLWGDGFQQSMQDVISFAHSQGVIFVAAAGNDSTSDFWHWPAMYEHVLAIAATDSNDDKASFSNYGDWVDIAAPGVDILSLRANGTAMGTVYDDYTTIASGTSMACPHVAGACAYLLSLAPVYSPEEIVDLLMQNGDPIADGICISDSRLNLGNAVQAGLSSQGRVKFDEMVYSCSDTIEIALFDYDLNAQTQQAVTLTTTGGDTEVVTLTETGYGIGVFDGSISTDSGTVDPNDGVLQISHGETITVTYDDLDDGTGYPATATDTATADCHAPSVSNLEIEVPGPDPTITLKTNEDAVARIRCGLQCGGPYDIEVSGEMGTSHTLELVGVEPLTDYYYIVEVTDIAGNTYVDDNAGNCYAFTTTGVGDIYVPSQVSTIQKAIDYSWDGGTVWVADGTYSGNGNRDINFMGRAITVTSENGADYCTIDCNGSDTDHHRAFIFESGEDASSVLDGFTIKNGNYLVSGAAYNVGGGFYCEGSSPTIKNCIIRDCKADLGGGFYNTGGSPAFISCTFKDNSVPGNLLNCGAGVFTDGGIFTFSDCTFDHNSSTGTGGGIYVGSSSSNGTVTITNCDFISNYGGGYGGGGIYCNSPGEVIVTGCNFINNRASFRGCEGGGMYARGDLTLTDCIFTGNRAIDGDPDWDERGGALCTDGTATISNCEFYDNETGCNGGAIYHGFAQDLTVSSCILQGNTAVDGGAIALVSADGAILTNCIFASNSATGNGGAIYGHMANGSSTYPDNYDSDITTNFCTFYNNQANQGDVVYYTYNIDDFNEDFVGKFTNSIIWGSSDPIYLENPTELDISYCDVQGGYVGDGNINSDPNFVDATNGDLRLQIDSPCIDAGDPESASGIDFQGLPRPMGARVDMGAYEYCGIYNEGQQSWLMTIQSAVDDAVSGESIVLGPKVYSGDGNRDIDFSGKAITIRSTAPSDISIVESTIIDCQATDPNRYRGFYFHSGEDENSVLDGVTIIHAMAPYDSVNGIYPGAAIFCDNASGPTVRNCILKDNVDFDTSSDGAAIACYNGSDALIENCDITENASAWGIVSAWLSSPTVINCNISDNTETSAAIAFYEAADGIVRNCNMSNNQVTTQWGGTTGGVLSYGSEVFIENCTMTGNTAYNGGGLYLEGNSNAIIRNCLIANNTSYFAGGGICSYFSNALIDNCTIADNDAVGTYGFGGGINIMGGTLDVSNSIFWGNIGNDGNQIKRLISSPTFSYCDIQDSGGSANWDTTLGTDGGNNIDIDPNFVDSANGDYHIALYSPCVDTGDPTGNFTGQYDMDGEIRLMGVAVDIGSDEYFMAYNTTTQIGYGTIQSAVDAAVTGDVIELYPGTYSGDGNRDIDFGGKAITIRSIDPSNSSIVESTVIDCQATESDRHRGFYFHSGEDANSVLDGVTIIHAMAPYDSVNGLYPGAAIFCDDASSPTIRNCIMRENIDFDSSSDGAAIACYNNSNATVEDCVITNNASGFAIVDAWNSSPTIRNCIISDNTDTYVPVSLYENANGIIENCTIQNNNAPGGTGGIWVYNSSAQIENCVVTGNDAESGGGLYIMGGTNTTVRNCLISNNFATGAGGGLCNYWGTVWVSNCTIANNEGTMWGGGIFALSGSTDVKNSIIWGNSSDDGNQIKNLVASITFSFCDIQDSGGSENWDTILGTDGGGNIDADPNFVDLANGDYHLQPVSPCLDIGDPNGVYTGQTDIDGQPRLADGDGDQAAVVDMGADEYMRVINLDQQLGYIEIQDAINAANNSDEIVVYPATYDENINFFGKNITVRSSDPENWDIVRETIIAGTGTTNTVQLGWMASNPVLSGLTITGGTRGVYAVGAGPIAINHCIVTENDKGVFATGNVSIDNCIIKENENEGVYLSSGQCDLKNSFIFGNDGGVFVNQYSSITAYNCTIVNNYNYGVSKGSPAGAAIKNCILWDNNDDLVDCTATYSCIEDGDAGTGNISIDPNFVDAANDDYHISGDSPCIDAGDNSAVLSGDVDIDGDDRILDGDGDQTATVDMGADEYSN